jgi:2-polyprenyl-6-methoxyphenol hydroxylase-like FAD-dependent oxidoreductase
MLDCSEVTTSDGVGPDGHARKCRHWRARMREKVDVLVVGAGASGLLLATELLRAGAQVLLIGGHFGRSLEKAAGPARRRPNKLLGEASAVEDIVGSALLIQDALANQIVTATLDDADFALGSSPDSGAPTRSGDERILSSALREVHGRIVYGFALHRCEVTDSVILAWLVGGEGERREVECSWLVGCEDTHDEVRGALGCVAADKQQITTAVALAELDVAWSEEEAWETGHDAENPVATVRNQPHTSIRDIQRRYELMILLPDVVLALLGEASGQSSAEVNGSIARVVRRQFPAHAHLGAVRWLGLYCSDDYSLPSTARHRVFLLGDAAHLPSRNAARKSRVGLEDAHNLAWKLALAVRGLATPHLLDSYMVERRPADRLPAIGVTEDDGRQTGLDNNIEVRVNYRESSIVLDDRPDADAAPLVAGDHVPDAGPLNRPLSAQTFGLHEWLGRGRHVLMGFVADAASVERFAEMRRCFRDILGDLGGGVAIIPPSFDPPLRGDLPLLIDTHLSFVTAFRARAGMFWAVRPDGYLGWCSEAPSVPALKLYLRRIIAVVPEDGP